MPDDARSADQWRLHGEEEAALTAEASQTTQPDLPVVQHGQTALPPPIPPPSMLGPQPCPQQNAFSAQPAQASAADQRDLVADQGTLATPQVSSSGQSSRDPVAPTAEVVFTHAPVFGRPHSKIGEARNLPSLPNAIPDTVLDGADFERLTVRAASLRGDEHRYYGEPRQDSVALWQLVLRETDVILACVADGVGSEPNSHEGSAQACQLLREELEKVESLPSWDDRQRFARNITERVAGRMSSYAEGRGLFPRTLSTTLVAAAVESTPTDGRHPATILRVGDSTAFVLRNGVFQECFPNAHKSEDVQESGTFALPGRPGMVEVDTVMLGIDDVLVLCTDGLSNPMHNDEVREQLVKWWSTGPVPGILEFGWQLGFRAKSYGDDRSAVCVWGR
ncbi:hypothetical protein GCM10009735_38420 [Actinomadura chokoriensis]